MYYLSGSAEFQIGIKKSYLEILGQMGLSYSWLPRDHFEKLAVIGLFLSVGQGVQEFIKVDLKFNQLVTWSWDICAKYHVLIFFHHCSKDLLSGFTTRVIYKKKNTFQIRNKRSMHTKVPWFLLLPKKIIRYYSSKRNSVRPAKKKKNRGRGEKQRGSRSNRRHFSYKIA